MRDVIVVGGGLSGLLACYELEKLGILYTLIEVKQRLGGSIQTIHKDDFVMDAGAFMIEQGDYADILSELGLDDSVYSSEDNLVAFQNGTETLINTLQAKITAPKMTRMAVNSLGTIGGKYVVCLENGLVLDTKAIILATPAKYTERMFYGYIPEISTLLQDYHYDTVLRVSMGYHQQDIHTLPILPPVMAYVFCHKTSHPQRVPDGKILFQFGFRIKPQNRNETDIIDGLRHTFGWGKPLTYHIGYWAEADSLSRFHDEHEDIISKLHQLLPEGIAVIGSDYSTVHPTMNGTLRLDVRIQQAKRAVTQIQQVLNA